MLCAPPPPRPALNMAFMFPSFALILTLKCSARRERREHLGQKPGLGQADPHFCLCGDSAEQSSAGGPEAKLDLASGASKMKGKITPSGRLAAQRAKDASLQALAQKEPLDALRRLPSRAH